MFIAIKRGNTSPGPEVLVFTTEKGLTDWVRQVGSCTVADYTFRRLGEIVKLETTTTTVIC